MIRVSTGFEEDRNNLNMLLLASNQERGHTPIRVLDSGPTFDQFACNRPVYRELMRRKIDEWNEKIQLKEAA
jgi:hypothetical protein